MQRKVSGFTWSNVGSSLPNVISLHAWKRTEVKENLLPFMVPEVIFCDWTIKKSQNCKTQKTVQLRNTLQNPYSQRRSHRSNYTSFRPKGFPQLWARVHGHTSQWTVGNEVFGLVNRDISLQVNNNTWRPKHSENKYPSIYLHEWPRNICSTFVCAFIYNVKWNNQLH